jgi:thiamine-monophosphate kinase
MSGREFEIIERYFSGAITFETDNVVLGPGDDCAILRVPEGLALAVSTDTFNEGVHFPVNAPGNVVAHRCLCANLSDLAAMGARPFAFTLALTMPTEDDSWLSEFSATLGDLVSRHEIPLVGGNLSRGSLSCTLGVMGTLPHGKGLRRSGASEGEDLYVSGTLGDAAGGLKLLGAEVPGAGQLLESYCYPVPRVSLGESLLDIATAAIDISDGLSSEVDHICRMSGVGAKVRVEMIPMSESLLKHFDKQDALALAVGGGDDYELLFSAPASARSRIEEVSTKEGVLVSRIGEIVSGNQLTFLDAEDRPITFSESGYQHFNED